jgi:hypothetical protein
VQFITRRALFHPRNWFIFEKQLREADLICVSKSDIYPDAPRIGNPTARQISAKTGQGVAAWLDEVLSGGSRQSNFILELHGVGRECNTDVLVIYMLNFGCRFSPGNAGP